jgi:hypothetical protein
MIALTILSGCGQGSPARVLPDKPDPGSGDKAMELYDTNKDGFLDAKELEKVPGLKAALQTVDTNHDGKISAAEISARITAWADSKLGRMGVVAVINHNGQPLPGAKVRFVPESFLGTELKPAEATTDAHGLARPRMGGSQGICPGFYRVEVTKDGEHIPAKYNTETQLGQEVATDAANLPNGVATFELKY